MKPSPRDRMVGAALKLFQRQGYANTSWRRLVEESGAPWGSAHHYFPEGKEQLGLAAIELAAQEVAGFIEGCFSPKRSAAEGVQVLFELSAARMKASDYCDGCPIATLALETASTSPALAQACRHTFEHWRCAMEAGLARCGIAEDRVANLSTTLLSLFEGGLLVARVARSTEPLLQAARAMTALLGGADRSAPQLGNGRQR